MLTIDQKCEANTLTLGLVGRLDTTTAPQLEAALENTTACAQIDMDFAEVKYVSSAGLRVLLKTQKKMKAQGGQFVIHNVNEEVMEVLEMTGFADILTLV